jgi:putative membrane protein
VKAAWHHINGAFLLSVLAGILVSIFSLARLISWLIAQYPLGVWAFFFGLIAASAIYVGKQISNWKLLTYLFLLSGFCLALLISVASPANTPETYWFIFISGCIAISAMILPGISGSFILLLLGKYAFMMHAVKTLQIDILGVFLAGCILGIIAFSNVISWLLLHYRNLTMAFLTGLMAGSLNKLWPWKEVLTSRINEAGESIPLLEKSISPMKFEALYGQPPLVWQLSLLALAGFGLVFAMDALSKKSAT